MLVLTTNYCSIPEFLTGARYQATDSLTPGWLAAYDIADVSLFTDDKYTKLRANRSPREGALVVRLETLDRRSCESIDKTGDAPSADNAAPFVLTIASNELKGDGKDLSGVKGWRRSHRHLVYDCLTIGFGKTPVTNGSPKYLLVHGKIASLLNTSNKLLTKSGIAEFDDESFVQSPEYHVAIAGQPEVRRWKLYKSTANTA